MDMTKIFKDMLEETKNGKVWLQPLVFPNEDKQFHYYMGSDEKEKLWVLRFGEEQPHKEEVNEALEKELFGEGKSQGVKLNSDVQDLKNIENDEARKKLTEAAGIKPEAGEFDEEKSRELFRQAKRDISQWFNGFPTEEEQIECFTKLLEEGADPNFGDDDGTTLTRLCFKGHLKAVKLLLDSGKVKINQQTPYMRTTGLLEACRTSNDNNGHIVKLLLEAGADVKLRNKNNENALHCLCYEGCCGPTSSMAAVLLINAGLDPNEPGYCGYDDAGKTGLQMAEKKTAYTDDTRAHLAKFVETLKNPAGFELPQ